MSLATALEALQDSSVAHAISKSNHLVGAGLQAAHIFGIVLLLAPLLLVSLRLLGWVLADTPLPVVAREARRFIRIGKYGINRPHDHQRPQTDGSDAGEARRGVQPLAAVQPAGDPASSIQRVQARQHYRPS